MKKNYLQMGTAFVEFAIVLPLLLLITFGIIEFGLLMFNKQVITNASREGARAGIVATAPRLTYNSIESIVLGYCADHLVTFGAQQDPPDVEFFPETYDPDATSLVDSLTVIVEYDYSWLVPIWGKVGLPDPLVIRAETTMRYE